MTEIQKGFAHVEWDDLWKFFVDASDTYTGWATTSEEFEGITIRYVGWLINSKRHKSLNHPTPFKVPAHVTTENLREAYDKSVRNGTLPRIPADITDHGILQCLYQMFLIFNYIWGGWHGLNLRWIDSQPDDGANTIPYEEEEKLIQNR